MNNNVHHCSDTCPERILLLEAVPVYSRLLDSAPGNLETKQALFRDMVIRLLWHFNIFKGKSRVERERIIEHSLEMFSPYIDRFEGEPYCLKEPKSVIASVLMVYAAVKETSTGVVSSTDQSLLASHIVWLVQEHFVDTSKFVSAGYRFDMSHWLSLDSVTSGRIHDIVKKH